MSVTIIAPPTEILDEQWNPNTAIPQDLRAWGYFPDTTAWHPGDLILTKSSDPDRISRAIEDIQEIGYGTTAAAWTHAAIYLGDGLMLCEAQLDPMESICNVIAVKLWSYVGTHDIMVRRSKHAAEREAGWAIAVAAATKIGSAYDWRFILRLAADRTFVGEDVFLRDQTGKITSNAYICSSLYPTAHAYVTDVSRSLTERMVFAFPHIWPRRTNISPPSSLVGSGSHELM
jgi:hypothetical protein